MIKVVNGVEVEMTEAEILEWEVSQSIEPPPLPAPRKTAMWRARAIAKTTGYVDGVLTSPIENAEDPTLFQAIITTIEALPDSLMKVTAMEAIEYGSEFDLDGQMVPMLMALLELTEADVLPLILSAERLPA